MLNEILMIIALTFFPFLELRASIPYGIIATSVPVWLVFVIAVIVNLFPGIILYLLLDKLVHFISKSKRIHGFYSHHVERTQKRIHKYVERYGWLGVAIFIGIPLPGSGSYSGAIAAYAIGLDFKRFVIANIIGVTIAAILVTAIVLSGSNAFQFLVR